MAKNKKPRKGKAVRHGVRLDVNVRFWRPINAALIEQAGGYAQVAAVSEQCISDRLFDALVQPISQYADVLKEGTAELQPFWSTVQTYYFLHHAVEYVLKDEKFSFVNSQSPEFHNEYWHKKYEDLLEKIKTQYSMMLRTINERQGADESKIYRATDEEHSLLLEMKADLEELLGWGSLRMVYRACKRSIDELAAVENSVRARRDFKLEV